MQDYCVHKYLSITFGDMPGKPNIDRNNKSKGFLKTPKSITTKMHKERTKTYQTNKRSKIKQQRKGTNQTGKVE